MVSVNAIPPSMVKTCQTGAAPIPDWWKVLSLANGTLLASVMPEAFTTVPITVRTPASCSSRCALATADSSADVIWVMRLSCGASPSNERFAAVPTCGSCHCLRRDAGRVGGLDHRQNQPLQVRYSSPHRDGNGAE